MICQVTARSGLRGPVQPIADLHGLHSAGAAVQVPAARLANRSGCAAQRVDPRQSRPCGRSLIRVYAAATPVPASPDKERPFSEVLVLGLLFGGWYLANIAFNIFNKQVLKEFPYPLTCTTLQFVVGSAIVLLSWATRVVKKPDITPAVAASVFPLAIVHILGNSLTNVSLGAVAVSFTHTIKALEPFFSVLLSAIFLGDKPSPWVILSLFPIVFGVGLASVTEASFNWKGFLAAMGSNLTFQSRNVLSKKLMIKRDALDNVSLFSVLTLMSALLLLPITLARDGLLLTPQSLTAMGVSDPWSLLQKAVSAGACFHLYQQISYMILQRVSPVTHSVGNCVKRVIVIVASVIFFQNPMSTQNAIGTAIALGGVFLYSRAKKGQAPPPPAAPKAA